MVLGKLDSHMQKMKIEYYLTPYTKINSKCVKNLKVRPENIKLEVNTGSVLFFISLKNIFLDMSPQARKTKAKINKWDSKLKSSCMVKETFNETKGQPTEWEKIFANHISDKPLISKNI